MHDGDIVAALRRGDAAEAELRCWPGEGLAGETVEQVRALVEIAGVEKRFGEFDPRRQIAGETVTAAANCSAASA